MRSKLVLQMLAAVVALQTGAAQEALDRTAQLSGGWIGIPGAVETHLRQLVWRPAAGASLVTTSNLALGFTPASRVLLGTVVSIQSTTVPASPTEWELNGRVGFLDEQRGSPATVAGAVAWNGAATSLDGEASVARWLGAARLLSSVRVFSNAYDEGGARVALGAGAVVHPRPGGLPVAVSADVVSLADRGGAERVAWSAGVSAGIGHTSHTIALFATNGTSATLQGTSRGTGRARYGVEVTLPMGIGRLFGWYPERGEAAQAVRGDASATPAARVEMRRFLFESRTVEIAVGETVEWVNRDDVVHTVNAEDGAWQSGAVPAGARWRATFSRPGEYVYYCGPHPYMRGSVIVR